MKSYITLISSDEYLIGLLSLLKQLKHYESKYPMCILYTDNLKEETKSKIKETNCNVVEVPNLGLMESRYNWHNTFSKFEIFNQTQFDKLVYLDVDILLRCNVDELFEHEHLSMCWFGGEHENLKFYNSGVMVLKPSRSDYDSLFKFFYECLSKGKVRHIFLKTDQQIISYILNDDINELDNIYNMDSRDTKTENPKIVHFVKDSKPWNKSYKPINDKQKIYIDEWNKMTYE